MSDLSAPDSATPVVLKEGTTRTKGRDAQGNNLAAALLLADIISSSLGPRGLDKMLVDTTGDAKVTNDGATMLKEM
ncbi:MAG: TCP-1/cpn60 chaperonin family protein, partial [Nitrososphaerales archaeon]